VPLIKHFFREFPRRREESSPGKKTVLVSPSLRKTFILPSRRFHDRGFTKKCFFPQKTGFPGRRPEYPGCHGGLAMSLLISGIVSVILGVIGFSLWWSDFMIILKGGIPIMLILGGVLAVYVGLDAMEDRMREERHKQEEKLEKTREEIERVKAQAEQYRDELEKLKEQANKNTP
jgi:hypothetical protein